MSDMEIIEQRFSKLKNFEDDKDQFIQDLIDKLKGAEAAIKEGEDELKREKWLSKVFEQKAQDVEEKLSEKYRERERMSFISVLIDGDCMNFRDDFVRNGRDGAKEALNSLKTTVTKFLRESKPETPPKVQIKVRMYANVKGLSKKYKEANILPDTSDFYAFIRGFNMEDALCDFIDAGDGKECADFKLKALFEQDIADVHCFHVIFGGSADNGYARLLTPYRESTKVTLLEGRPFAWELEELASQLGTVSSQNVFRRTDFSCRTVPLPTSPPGTPAPNYASVARIIPGIPSSSIIASGSVIASKVKSEKPESTIALNAQNQRVDLPLTFNSSDLMPLKKEKYCNNWHILGECDYPWCNFRHGDRLEGSKLQALRQIARMSPCYQGLACRDEKCISGHRCFKSNCMDETCRFGDMHYIDTTPCQYVK